MFNQETFALLAGIAVTPTAGFYQDHKAAFKQNVEQPFQGWVKGCAAQLPALMTERLETRRNLFSRFLKNDFGRGGAWSHYWAAFYPRGSRRISDLQMVTSLDAQGVQVGWYIPAQAAQRRDRFLRNLKAGRWVLVDALGQITQNELILPARGALRFDAEGRAFGEDPLTWAEWLEDPHQTDFWLGAALGKAALLRQSAAEVERWALNLHEEFFVLTLLAMEDEPFDLIEAYLGEF